MILTTKNNTKIGQLDLTPLINIVFLILIFFMLAGSIKPVDDIQAARTSSGSSIDTELLIIAIDSDGNTRIGKFSSSDDELNEALLEQKQRNGLVGIKPDARLPAQRLVEISAMVQRAGFSELTLITRDP
ncbi:MAG: ExbD/TolR family protein [Granulosicoccus sp.]